MSCGRVCSRSFHMLIKASDGKCIGVKSPGNKYKITWLIHISRYRSAITRNIDSGRVIISKVNDR